MPRSAGAVLHGEVEELEGGAGTGAGASRHMEHSVRIVAVDDGQAAPTPMMSTSSRMSRSPVMFRSSTSAHPGQHVGAWLQVDRVLAWGLVGEGEGFAQRAVAGRHGERGAVLIEGVGHGC